MVISYQWLLQYLPQPLPLMDLSSVLTSIGLEVEGMEKSESVKGGLEGIIIGKVLTCKSHENADKLRVTTVDIGADTPVQIVCGAPNVAAGQTVVIAPVGSTVHPLLGDAFPIKKAKIRGELSEGMICAEDEIGLGQSHEGILVLEQEVPPGTLAKDYFKLAEPDFAIHIGLTPNRSDANSHIGVARDVCAWLSHHKGANFRVALPETERIVSTSSPATSIEIEETDACPRYMGIQLKHVKVGASPEWIKQRLLTIGIRSINNVVDITNFVLHEYGQPLHAFDADKVQGGKIVVRYVPEGTVFKTLDDKDRTLRATDLMICDAENPLAMAGVFGGKNSGITENTHRIFIESACFNPTVIRRTSLYHGLRTDAATHYEKGVDLTMLEPAMLRAASLMIAHCGAEIESAAQDVWPLKPEQKTITASFSYFEKLSGKAYQKEEILNLLTALGFEVKEKSDTHFTVGVPGNMQDVSQPADLVEEVLRIDGLDNIAIPERLNISLGKPRANDRALHNKVANELAAMGYQELVTNSITNSKYYPQRKDLVHLLNSLSSELDILRPEMLESGLEVLAFNINRKNQDLLLFDLGHVYHQPGEAGVYVQLPKLMLYSTGNARPKGWNNKAIAADMYFLSSTLKHLLQCCGIHKTTSAFEGEIQIAKWKNQELYRIFEVSEERRTLFGIKQATYAATIDWNLWTKAVQAAKVRYTEVPKHPSVQRDLALVLDKLVPYEAVELATNKLKLEGLQHFDVFDIFESEKLGQEKKSLALNFTFQLPDRTLTDAEVDAMMKKLADAYSKDLNAQIRS